MSGWTRKKIADLIDGLSAGVSVRSTTGVLGGKRILKTSCVANGQFIPGESKPILLTDISRARCHPVADSVLISRMNTPSLVGDVCYVPETRRDLYLPDRLWLARAKRGSNTDMRWLTYYFASEPGAQELRGLATGTSGSMKNIPKARVLNLEISTPSPEEQVRIGDAITAADNMIAGLERMIDKKQAIKHGMMQQLLTGRTRLPGFTSPWVTTTLGALGTFLKGRGVKRDDVRSSGVRCIRYGELYTSFNDYTTETRSFVSNEVATTALPLKTGDLMFTGSGETRDEIGKCVAYMGPTPAVAGGDVIVLRGDQFNSVYLALLTNTPEVVKQKARAGQGDAVVHIYSNALAAVEVSLPPRAEQDAIANIIVDADREVALLRRRLQKARDIKHGMMQELLTGRTRLPLKEVAA